MYYKIWSFIAFKENAAEIANNFDPPPCPSEL